MAREAKYGLIEVEGTDLEEVGDGSDVHGGGAVHMREGVMKHAKALAMVVLLVVAIGIYSVSNSNLGVIRTQPSDESGNDRFYEVAQDSSTTPAPVNPCVTSPSPSTTPSPCSTTPVPVNPCVTTPAPVEPITCQFIPVIQDTNPGSVDVEGDGFEYGICKSADGERIKITENHDTIDFEPYKWVTLRLKGTSRRSEKFSVETQDVVRVGQAPGDTVIAKVRDGRQLMEPKVMSILTVITQWNDVNVTYMTEKEARDQLYNHNANFADMISSAFYGKIIAPRSYGKTVTVYMERDWATFGSDCPTDETANAALLKVTEQFPNIDVTKYTNKEFFIPQHPSLDCNWIGYADMGCAHLSVIGKGQECNVWYRAANAFTRAHELGHTFGFAHAGGKRKGTEKYVDYGDDQAIMGNNPYQFSSYNLAARYQLGVLGIGKGEVVTWPTYVDVNGMTQPITIQSMSLAPGSVEGADFTGVRIACEDCIPMVEKEAANVGGYLWVQFRGDEGYSAKGLNKEWQNKVYVHLARKYRWVTHGSGTEHWATMTAGEHFEPTSIKNNFQLSVRVCSITGDMAKVSIAVGEHSSERAEYQCLGQQPPASWVNPAIQCFDEGEDKKICDNRDRSSYKKDIGRQECRNYCAADPDCLSVNFDSPSADDLGTCFKVLAVCAKMNYWQPSTMYTKCADPNPPTTLTSTSTRAPCKDTDSGIKHKWGLTCSRWRKNWCGNYDDDPFLSNELCCVCGGGTYYIPPTTTTRDPNQPTTAPCEDTANGAIGKYSIACSWYANYNERYCGRYDDDDFAAKVMCCNCGGGTYYTQ